MDNPQAPVVHASEASTIQSTPYYSGRAPIERLPIELTHKIFLQSLEFNLPRASLHVSNALSTEVIYTWLIRLAFSSNNPSSKTSIFDHPYLPLDYFSLSSSARTHLQEEILKCRWLTPSLLRKCQREYVEHVLAKKASHLTMSENDRHALLNLDPYWDSMNRFDVTPPGRRGKGEFMITCAEPPTSTTDPTLSAPASRKLSIWFNFGAVQIRSPSPVFQDIDVFQLPCSTGLAELPRIPDRFLTAPWTDEKFELLILFSCKAYIDENERFERSKAVLRQLIQDRDFEPFKRLLSLHIRIKIYEYPLRWPVRPNHFRVAARCATSGRDDPFLRYLFEQRKEDVPVNDRSITALMAKYKRVH
ncbi:hypothetical protein FQN57_002388 [Myotisia sp. PD_48]|nr:hypothetical protein FQN57_002388 [Myotisia sp. PD_48]